MSTQITSFPISAKHAAVTSPTYPAPAIAIFIYIRSGNIFKYLTFILLYTTNKMKLIEFFELEGLFLIYMFVQFVSLLIWSFYLTANLNADLAAASPMVYFLSAIIADFLLCIVIFLVATYFYIRNEEK